MKKNKDAKPLEDNKKMTIYEYEQKYAKRQNLRGARLVLKLLAAALGVLIFAMLFFVVKDLWAIHMYAGIAGTVVAVILFICLYIVPLVKIMKTGYFEVNVNAKTARAAQKHNKRVRHEIADKIIEVTSKVEGVGWYDSQVVGALAIAVNSGDEEGIKLSLTELYTGSVKKSAKALISKSSLRCATYSALSQSNKVDSLLVAFLNLQLVKDLVYLYGFRPSDAKLVKIFARVLQNSLIAYGLGSAKIGNSIVKSMGDAVRSIPLLGSAISVIVDCSVQGLTNGVLSAVIGYQTIKYLNDEYKLQEILDGVEIAENEEDFKETCAEIEKELKTGKRKLQQAV